MVTSRRVISLLLSRRDHPHACGDKRHHVFLSASKTGSSPRVWGQVFFYAQQTAALRIIPTRVGTSVNTGFGNVVFEDHPHACGDKYIRETYGDGRRIIPTRVGTRALKSRTSGRTQDHPHACGDKTAIPIRTGTSVGSSPRVWGQVHCAFSYNSSQRIIPTRVRTRLYHRTFNLSIGDHPHACGDKLHRLIRRLLKRGSSPRVWGQEIVFF